MTVSTEDLRVKLVLDELIDKESRSFYLSNLWQDVSKELGAGQQLDIGEVTDALDPEDAVDSAGADQDLNVSVTTKSAHVLKVDIVRAIARELPLFDEMFTMQGSWAGRVADKILKKLKNDRDSKDVDYLLRNPAAAFAGTYHVNPSAGNLSKGIMGKALAKMKNTDGVDMSDLVFMMNPYAEESMKLLPGWTANMEAQTNEIGIEMVGKYNGRPVYTSQSVPTKLAVGAIGVTVAGGDAVFDIPAANRPHGLVVGQKIWSSETNAGTTWSNAAGDDIPQATPLAITAADASSVTVAYAGSGATDASAEITLTTDGCMNLLARKDWLYQATKLRRFGLRIIPYGRERITDVLQAWHIWGRKAIDGCVQVIQTPVDVVVS